MEYTTIEYLAFILVIFGGMTLLYFLLKNLKVITSSILSSPFLILNEVINILLLPFSLVLLLFTFIGSTSSNSIKKEKAHSITFKTSSQEETTTIETSNIIKTQIPDRDLIIKTINRLKTTSPIDFKNFEFNLTSNENIYDIELVKANQFQFLYLLQWLSEELDVNKIAGESINIDTKKRAYNLYYRRIDQFENHIIGKYPNEQYFIVDLFKPNIHKMIELSKEDKQELLKILETT